MYQAIHYCRDDSPDKYHYFLRDDDKGIKKFKYFPEVYKLDEYGEHTTIFGDRCSVVKGKYNWKDPNILGKDIDRELVLLRDLYYKTEDKPKWNNLLYIDIEIEMLGVLNPQTIREAEAQITSITLYDNQDSKYYIYILDNKQELTGLNGDNYEVVSCPTEEDLILNTIDRWELIDPTIVAGFNSDFFDIPYVYYRFKRIVGDEVYRLSPIGKIDVNEFNPQSPIKIGLVSCLDYMLLFKKYIMKEEPSYKLDDIGTKYVGLGKIEYEGNLDKLFATDKEKFIKYNIRDVEIIHELEKKQKFIELTVMISHLCHTPYESIYYNTVLNEGAILSYLKRENIIPGNKPTTVNPSIKELNIGDEVKHQRGTPTIEGIIEKIEDENAVIRTLSGRYIERPLRTVRLNDSYAGGFLLNPEPGLYDWLSDGDYASLYPSIIRSLNLSIETLVGRIVCDNQNYNKWNSLQELKERDPEEEILIEKLNKQTYEAKQATIKVKDLLELIEKQKWTISANGTIFDSKKISSVAKILTDWFIKRKGFKKKMFDAAKKGDKESEEFYNLMQLAFKILLNAMYGTYAINGWRFTDGFKWCSSAITNTGQRLVVQTIKYADELIKKEYTDGI